MMNRKGRASTQEQLRSPGGENWGRVGPLKRPRNYNGNKLQEPKNRKSRREKSKFEKKGRAVAKVPKSTPPLKKTKERPRAISRQGRDAEWVGEPQRPLFDVKFFVRGNQKTPANDSQKKQE